MMGEETRVINLKKISPSLDKCRNQDGLTKVTNIIIQCVVFITEVCVVFSHFVIYNVDKVISFITISICISSSRTKLSSYIMVGVVTTFLSSDLNASIGKNRVY